MRPPYTSTDASSTYYGAVVVLDVVLVVEVVLEVDVVVVDQISLVRKSRSRTWKYSRISGGTAGLNCINFLNSNLSLLDISLSPFSSSEEFKSQKT